MKEDKIFNNRFNTGEVTYESFGKIQVHDKFLPKDFFEEYAESELQQEIYKIFLTAPFYEEYSKKVKKVAKSDAAKIYYHFDENLKNTKEIPSIEKFIAIAEFMSISYEVLYEELGPVFKEALLKELDEKYKVFAKKKIKRLF